MQLASQVTQLSSCETNFAIETTSGFNFARSCMTVHLYAKKHSTQDRFDRVIWTCITHVFHLKCSHMMIMYRAHSTERPIYHAHAVTNAQSANHARECQVGRVDNMLYAQWAAPREFLSACLKALAVSKDGACCFHCHCTHVPRSARRAMLASRSCIRTCRPERASRTRMSTVQQDGLKYTQR